MKPENTRPSLKEAHAARSRAPRLGVDSAELLGAGKELIITHGADEYRLRLTRQGKLILTK